MSNLAGFTVAVTADRRRDEQAVLLERSGFEVRMFPLLRTEAAGGAGLRDNTGQIAGSPPDYLVANTGYGMRTWLGLAAEWGVLGDLTAALGTKTEIVARGAKALGELRKVGLKASYRAPSETLEEVVEYLLGKDLGGKEVVVQLHGDEPGDEVARLLAAGALVRCLGVYRMTSQQAGRAETHAEALSRAVIDGEVDVVTFTAAPQLQALLGIAGGGASPEQLLTAFNEAGVVAACIGPVCAAAARAHGIAGPLVPEHARLGSLASALVAHFAAQVTQLQGEHGPVSVSGRFAKTSGHDYELGLVERRALRALLSRGVPATGGPLGATEAELSRLSQTLDGALQESGGKWALVF